jgi:elongator complex protein 2
METSEVSCRLLHHGAAATSSSKAVICIPAKDPSSQLQSSEIVYASHAMLNVAHRTNVKVARGDKQEPVWKVYQTMRTDTKGSATANNTVATATAKRVITCVSHSKRRRRRQTVDVDVDEGDSLGLVCGFSDGTITSWFRQESHWTERILVCAVNDDFDGRAITDIGGLCDSEGNLVVVTCTSGGAYHYQFDKDSLISKNSMVHTPANALRFHTLESGAVLILVGTAAPRHNKIHVFLEEQPSSTPHYCGPLTGHEDWITCFDWFTTSSADVLASGSQDAKIRLWKFNTTTATSKTIAKADRPQLEEEDEDDEGDDDGNLEEEAEEGEARLEIFHNQNLTSVVLEALLIGHEERVTSVSWHPNPRPIYGQDLILISSSMDRTIFIWSEHESGVWTPISRVGSAGGILGGSIGSTLLGFLNTQLEPDHGRWLLGHGYGGALHFFSCEKLKETNEEPIGNNEEMTVEERAALYPWRAQPCLTGHFDGVTDLCWEAESGEYLITVSNDQTCRLWAPVPASSGESEKVEEEAWIEIARPQVHGYNLSAVTCLSTPDRPHLLVSGADEKDLRVFDATLAFIGLLRLITRGETVPPQDDKVERVERAYIPSLGLSNKATAADGAEEDTDGASESRTQLPLERDLGAMSLWPEVRKLYGHNTELARLASTVSARTSGLSFDSSEYSKDIFLASSAKARDVEAACIRIWDMKENRCIQVLRGGHRSTVAALSFSPDGRHLVSSGKDRRLCVWQRSEVNDSSSEQEKANKFFLTAAVDSAHKRIIWGVHFCPFEPTIFASGSRDGSVKIWKLSDALVEGKKETIMKELVDFSPICKGSNNKAEAVTSLAFSPLSISGKGLLALGLENGMIELWKIPLTEGEKPELAMCFPPQLCHIATVTKLAWRPHRAEAGEDGQLVLASSSSDHGCRIFQIACSSIA